MSAAADRLARLLEETPPRLAAISDDDAGRRPAAEKWSRREILGHLIDSAANNHQRFVRAQLVPHLDFPGYEQPAWVASQEYASEPWPDLVDLWLLYNRHLVHVMRAVPENKLAHTISLGGGAPMTLGFVIDAYLVHLEHHLAQIL